MTSINEIYLKKFEIFTDSNKVKKLKDQKWLNNYRENPNERVITIGYISLVNIQNFKPKASSFAQDVNWVAVKDIPELTFDHNDIVDSALKFLKNELNHEMSSFLLPKDFTIPQLQKLYEDVLNKKFDSRNFRKHFLRKGVQIKTKNKKTGRTGKPANFYQFEENEKKDTQKKYQCLMTEKTSPCNVLSKKIPEGDLLISTKSVLINSKILFPIRSQI